MTDSIRATVKREIKKRGLTYKTAAAAAVLAPEYLGDMLSGRKGNLPKSWAKLLDMLGLEVVVRPKRRGKGGDK